MSEEVAGSTVLLVGAMLIRITVTDVYQRYVKVSMGPWLLLAGVLLAGLGLVSVIRALRSSARGRPGPAPTQDHHDHDHPFGGDRVGWLLLAPVLALLLVAPPALGSYGLDRTSAVRVTTGAAVWTPLPTGDEPHPMTLLEANQRASDRSGASLGQVPVRLTGFVATAGIADPAGFRLARYEIACCAADAVPSVVHITGVDGAAPAGDSWATVTGRYTGTASDGLPRFQASSIQAITAPVDPYE